MRFLCWLHGLFLNLFPRAYRDEYTDELKIVFSLSLADAMRSGKWDVLGVAFHEFISLPGAIICEHLRERRRTKMLKRFGSHFDFASGSFLEFFSALYPFLLLGGVLPMMNILTRSNILAPQSALVNGIAIVLLAILGILCLIGLAKGLPRWALTYLGFLLALFSVYQFGMWLENKRIIPFDALYERSWFLGQVAYQGMLWVGVSVVIMLLTLLIGFIPFLRRFRKDWTLLSLVIYGTSPFALVFAFDDYVNEEPYELLAFLILAAGLWLYLRTHDSRKQFWALLGGLTFSLLIAAASKALLFSSPSWPWPRRSFTWQNEMMSTVIMWMWIALGMLIPLIVRLFPRQDAQAGEV